MEPTLSRPVSLAIRKNLDLNNQAVLLQLLMVLLIASLSFPRTVQAQTETQIPVLILLTGASDEQFESVQKFLEDQDGKTVHQFPQQGVIANARAETVPDLASLPGVAATFTQAVDLSLMDTYGAEARRLAGVWNNLLDSQDSVVEVNLMATEQMSGIEQAFMPPDFLAETDVAIAAENSVTPGYHQTSEYMAGSIAVGIVLVESDGSVDPSTENWTEDEKQLVFREVVGALNWWSEQEPRANLSFVYDDHFSKPLPTSVEPITRPYSDEKLWIQDAMSALGYEATSYFTSVLDYNNALRDAYQTDWAFTMFVVDSSNDGDNHFKDGYFAYAYIGGPFLVLTSGNSGYGSGNLDAVAAHEVGHIFHALDQYSHAHVSCTRRSGYLSVENQNSEYGNCLANTPSIMRGQIYPFQSRQIDPWAAGQIGWRDSDHDGVFDPLDTALPISVDELLRDGNWVTVRGNAHIVPYSSPSRLSVTINKLAGVRYRIDGKEWQPATARDGRFDATGEGYEFTTTISEPGLHTLEVAAFDSAGNVSNVFATRTVQIFDPVDGGLNTELYPPKSGLTVGSVSPIDGTAYHMEGKVLSRVEYRINGGPWQAAAASDGAFNSDYEAFYIPFDTAGLDVGTYRLEARAIDAEGNTEVNFASYEVEVKQLNSTFLPMIIR